MESRTVYAPSYVSSMTEQGVSTKRIKEQSLGLSSDHLLRTVLLLEPDIISPQEYIVKLPGWLRLLSLNI